MKHTRAPLKLWLTALHWVCYIMNTMYNTPIDTTPLERLMVHTLNILNMFQFMFYEKVYYVTRDALVTNKKPKFPLETHELPRYFVGEKC